MKIKKYSYIIFGIISTIAIFYSYNYKGTIIDISKVNIIGSLFFGMFLVNFYKKNLQIGKNPLSFKILSLLFSFFMVFGYSYNYRGNCTLIFGSFVVLVISIIKYIGYYVLFLVSIKFLYDKFITLKLPIVKNTNKVIDFFNRHPFWFSIIVILICYLPYIISYYPAIMTYDSANQIKEVMGIPNRYMQSVNLLDPNFIITNFNPVIHTLLIGGCFKIGTLLSNVNLGLFIYSIIQISIMVSVFAYSIVYLKKIKINDKLIFIVLAIYSLVPLFPLYCLTVVKDGIFSALMLLYIIKLYDVITNNPKTRDFILLFLITLAVTLFRNNGVYAVIFCLPVMIIVFKKIRKPLLIVLICFLVVNTGYNKILLPSLKITSTSIREMLSVPFQQTARYAKRYGNELTEEEIEVIDNILEYDTLAERYVPSLSDAVKNKYNKDATNEDLKDYFKVWFNGLIKHPRVYIDATINNIYGYFYPNTTARYVYTNYNNKLKEAGYDYHFNDFKSLRNTVKYIAVVYPYIPVIGFLGNIGLVVWGYMFLVGSLIVSNKKKFITLIIPGITILISCILGPANTYYRYIIPLSFALPFIICIIQKEIRLKK